MFRRNSNVFFISRPFWAEMNIPEDFVLCMYQEYFGKEDLIIHSRTDAISFISPILSRVQQELLDWLKSTNSNFTLKSLYLIFDKCFKYYMAQKSDRQKLVEFNINDNDIIDSFSINRNMALNVINSVNLWLENILLFQNKIEEPLTDTSTNIDQKLFIQLYIYGVSSKALSLLTLSKKFGETGLFYGIKYRLQSEEPIDIIREHPVVYFNPSLIGNQDVFNVSKEDYSSMDHSSFGKGFYAEYECSLLLSMRLMSTFQKHILKGGKLSYGVMTKDKFLAFIDKYTPKDFDPHKFFDTFVLTNSTISTQLKKKDPIIWVMGTNKYRHELRPFICLDNETIAISYMALEQSKNIWLSYFANGGMPYSNSTDQLTIAIEKRNDELSKQLVDMIRTQLRSQYPPDFDECDVKYDRIFGHKEYDYGDYDIVFYTKQTNELFLIEAKFFSDSLNNSGIITDYEKLFKPKGYYEHCRNRYDLVIKEPECMKAFIGANGTINAHFLFLSSKPLEIEFTDKDGIVAFPCLSIFTKYLTSNLISEDGSETIRPIHQI